jgi:hypothetical protein
VKTVFSICMSLIFLMSFARASGVQGNAAHSPEKLCSIELLQDIIPDLDPTEKHSAESAEWKRLSVRDASKPMLDDHYLGRLHASLKEVFAPWFRKEAPLNGLPFSEILRQQHIVLVTGVDGSEHYAGATLIAHDKVPSHVPEGLYRDEGYRLHEDGHIMTFRTEAKLPEKSAHLQAMIDWYASHPEADKVKEPEKDIFPDPFTSSKASFDIIHLPRLRGDVKVWNEVFENYITHHYPAARDLPKLRDAMTKVMDDMRNYGPNLSHAKTWPGLSENLAEYLYLGIHAHPFEAGNYSLVMSQVNYILERAGLRGISHANLDYIGISEQFDDFKKAFLTSVSEVNPSDVRMKIPLINPTESKNVPLNIMAHISEKGDMRFRDSTIIEGASSRKPIEGIYLQPPALPKGVRLQYMGHILGIGDSEWIDAGTFLGTWGKSKSIEGLAFRVVGDDADKFEIVYQARMGDREWTAACKNGEYCGSRGQSKPLTAFSIQLKSLREH